MTTASDLDHQLRLWRCQNKTQPKIGRRWSGGARASNSACGQEMHGDSQFPKSTPSHESRASDKRTERTGVM